VILPPDRNQWGSGWGSLLMDDLVAAARQARLSAYAPYSGFAVGAALQSRDGRVFVGCNVENASYGLSICAERAAVAAAVSGGAKEFTRLVIATDVEPPSAPCGACRQVLSEFGADLVVDAVGSASSRSWRLGDLLPSRFGASDLGA